MQCQKDLIYKLFTPDLVSALSLCVQVPFMGTGFGDHRLVLAVPISSLILICKIHIAVKAKTYHEIVLVFPNKI